MERLALLGESAGAVMALLLGTSSEVGIPAPTDPYSSSAIEKFEGISGRVAAVISLSGGGIEFPKYSFFAQQPGFAVLPKEIQSYYRRLLDMKDEQRMVLSPITYLSSDDPPTLLINGDKDANVPISAAESGYQALLKAGVAAKLVKLAGAGHDSFNNADADRIHKETIDWLVEHLKVK
jgi:acetyl esterase/lipase